MNVGAGANKGATGAGNVGVSNAGASLGNAGTSPAKPARINAGRSAHVGASRRVHTSGSTNSNNHSTQAKPTYLGGGRQKKDALPSLGSTALPSGAKRGRSTYVGGSKQTHATRTARTGSGAGTGRPSAGSQLTFSRRVLVEGALGVGALAVAGGGGALAIRQAQENAAASNFDVLDVPASNMTTNSELTQIEDPSTCMGVVGDFELPYGTLLWCNDDNFAACLVPTEGANPLTQIGLLALGSGTLSTVLESAVGLSEKYEIYDVRATQSGIIWVEANILDGVWRVYSATTDGTALTSSPTLLEEQGSGLWETPSIAIVGNKVFWQMMPQQDGEAASENSVLKSATAGRSDTATIYEQKRRFACAPYGGTDTVTIAPHTESSSSYFQLTCIDAKTGEARDTCVLPASYEPSNVAYGETGFMFCLDAIYNTTNDEGIGNLGTYVPMEAAAVGAGAAALSTMPWFAFARTPLTAPAWCGDYLMVKSTTAVVGINMETKEYFVFDVENGADDYGEFLASEGSRDTIVTYTSIDYTPLSGAAEQLCRVKVYAPVS